VAFIAKLGERDYTIEIEEIDKSVYRLSIDGNEFLVDGRKTGLNNYSLIIDKRSFEVDVDVSEDEYRVLVDGRSYHIRLVDERRMRLGAMQSGIEAQGRQDISVPMPMKMENEVRSPINGEIKEIRIKPGETVEAGKILLVVE
jgi:acetyl/propionyl-CoA carboxylase alpha subunit